MPIRILIITALCWLFKPALGQFCYVDSVYDLNNYEQARCYTSLKYNDNKFLMVCYGATTKYFISLFAINSKGDTLWFKEYNIDTVSTNYALYKAAFDSSGNIIVAGQAYIDSVGGEQALLIKFDSSGNLTWVKTYTSPNYGEYEGLYGFAPIITNDDHYILVCQLATGPDTAFFLAVKTDTNGNELSRWRYGSAYYDIPWAGGIQASDSGFLFAGATDQDDLAPVGHGNLSIYVVKSDRNGSIQWDAIIPEAHDTLGRVAGDGIAWGIIEDTDGYIICGKQPLSVNYLCNIGIGPCAWEKCWVGKINKHSGSLLWEKFYGPDTLWDGGFHAINLAWDNNFVLCSKYDWDNYTANNAGIYKIDHNGDSLWSVFFNYHDSTNPGVILWSVNTIGTSGYLASGFVTPNNANPYPWVVTIDSNGYSAHAVPDTVTGILQINDEGPNIKLYPNPTTGQLYLTINTPEPDLSPALQIYDVSGRLILNQLQIPTNTIYTIDISNFANGIYFAQLVSNGNIIGRGKVVKE